jgi:hypothetical protein
LLESTVKNPHESPDPKIVYGAFAPWVHHGHENAVFSTFPPLLKLLQKEIRYEPSTKFSEMAPVTYVP